MIRAVVAAGLALCLGCGREPPRVTVGVAALLRNAMPELVARYRETSGVQVEVVYGASGSLADQVTAGAALDGLVLAEEATIDSLIAARTVVADSRRAIATTAIVLVGPAGAGIDFAGLAALPEGTKLAIGDPISVPAGRYARRYLEQIGVWRAVEPRVVLGGDVAAVLAIAIRGQARVAIVYRTDALRADPLVILDQPADGPVVEVVGGIVAASRRPAAARGFIEFLASPDARPILSRHGFAP